MNLKLKSKLKNIKLLEKEHTRKNLRSIYKPISNVPSKMIHKRKN